jgi:hypothetical protein
MFYAYGLVFILIALGYGKDLKFNKDERPKRRFAKILIFTAGFLLIVFPWIARNIKEFKTCQISQRGGTAIWTQAATAESLSPRELKAHFLYLISGRLAQKKFPDIVGNDMGSFEYRFYNKIPFEGLKQAGLSEGEIDIFLGKEAVKKIYAHPLKFIAFSTINYIQILKYFEPWSLLTLKGQNKWLSELVFPAVRFIAGIPAGLAFTLLAVLGIYFSRKYLVRYLFIVMIIGYYHFMLYFMGATPGGMQRFVLPVIPLFSFFACISIMRFFGGSGRSQSIIRESE